MSVGVPGRFDGVASGRLGGSARGAGTSHSDVAVEAGAEHPAVMVESILIPSAPGAAASPTVAQSLFPHPAALLQVLGDPVRWAVVRELAAGAPLPARYGLDYRGTPTGRGNELGNGSIVLTVPPWGNTVLMR